MAPTTTKTTTPKVQTRAAEDESHTELAQQFKNIKDYTTYVIARIQQADPSAHLHTPDPDATETEVHQRTPKRVKGRKRAANPVATVEASLRRQAELKSNFRSLARPLKHILDEMGRRTTDSLDYDSHAHEKASEHAHVKAGLQHALDERTTLIKRGGTYQRAQLDARHDAEERVLQARYEQSVRDAQDHALDDLDHRMLQIERRSRMAQAVANHDTDDEDDVILQPHSTSYRYSRGSLLPPEYDSRSRMGLAVDHAHGHLEARRGMQSMLDDQQDMPYEQNYTVMDSTVRDAALARRQAIDGVDMLASASQQVEHEARKKRPKKTSISLNREHTALMDLADVATRPRTSRNDMPPPDTTPLRRPATAIRIDPDDVFTTQTSASIGHKRSRSGTHILNSPLVQNLFIKEETPASPAVHSSGAPRASLPIKPVNDHAALPSRQPSLDSLTDRAARESSMLPRTGFDRPLSSRDDLMGGSYHDRSGDYPRRSPPRLASPFTGSSYESSYRASSEFGGHLRPVEFGYRPLLQHPPMPPTAQPVNHFANSNMHRLSFGSGSLPPPPPPSSAWSSPSPLVALPHGDTQRMPSIAPFFNGPPPSPYQHHQQYIPGLHNGPPPPAPPPPPNQYGGPMLAPAAGPYRTPQPAFAQQIGRQEQTRRRNTEGIVPRFREYRGPN